MVWCADAGWLALPGPESLRSDWSAAHSYSRYLSPAPLTSFFSPQPWGANVHKLFCSLLSYYIVIYTLDKSDPPPPFSFTRPSDEAGSEGRETPRPTQRSQFAHPGFFLGFSLKKPPFLDESDAPSNGPRPALLWPVLPSVKFRCPQLTLAVQKHSLATIFTLEMTKSRLRGILISVRMYVYIRH